MDPTQHNPWVDPIHGQLWDTHPVSSITGRRTPCRRRDTAVAAARSSHSGAASHARLGRYAAADAAAVSIREALENCLRTVLRRRRAVFPGQKNPRDHP